MSETPVYIVANLIVEDSETYQLYEKGFFPILKRHGGEFLTFDDAPHTFEGEAPRQGRMVLARFPSAAAAHAWYDDPDYQDLSKHRRAATSLKFLTLLHGLPAR